MPDLSALPLAGGLVDGGVLEVVSFGTPNCGRSELLAPEPWFPAGALWDGVLAGCALAGGGVAVDAGAGVDC